MDADAATGIIGAGIIGEGVISDGGYPDDLERRIAQRSEVVYRARLSQRLFVLWALLGTPALGALAALCFALSPPPWLLVLAVVVPLLSLLLSVRFVYRQHFVLRSARRELREAQHAHQEHLLEDLEPGDPLAAHKRYRALLPDVIRGYRAGSRQLRRRHNALQGVIIAGSIVTAVTTAVSMSIEDARWAAVLVSLVVALAASFTGYAKYRERSVSMQATSDALEREYTSVELRVGRYRRFTDEREAYAEFAHEAEMLRDDQAKRQQELGGAVRA